jgi:hypothetical protein
MAIKDLSSQKNVCHNGRHFLPCLSTAATSILMMYLIISKGEIMSKSEELKKELEVLTSRRDRMQQNLYEVEKRINEIVNKLKKQ